MGHELAVFGGSAALVIVSGFLIRLLAQPEGETFALATFDFTRDLFGAAAAVFPATLIIEAKHNELSMSVSEFGLLLILIVVIGCWAKWDSRYFCHWRDGMTREKLPNGKLGEPVASPHPVRLERIAFAIGTGLGFTVLYASTVLSHHIAS